MDGETPLFLASKYGDVDVARTLIKARADIDAVDKYGRTPLSCAVNNGHMAIVEMLMEAGANVNLQNEDGETPLLLASTNGHIDIARALIKARADIDVMDDIGWTPLSCAVHNGDMAIVEMLMESGANVNLGNGEIPLFVASRRGHVDIARALMKAGADINPGNCLEWSPLTLSISYDHPEISELLTSHIARLETAGLYVSNANLQHKDRFINQSYEWRRNYLQCSQNCKEEVEELGRENVTLYEFLKESDIDRLCSIWEKSESVSSKFNNLQNLKDRYPEYAHILINKANQVTREIFLHNHRPLVDVLSICYKCDFKKWTFAGIKNFFSVHSVDFKEKLGSGGVTLLNFVDFQGIKKRRIPTLKVVAFAKVFREWMIKE